jgi:hypothetical protein
MTIPQEAAGTGRQWTKVVRGLHPADAHRSLLNPVGTGVLLGVGVVAVRRMRD